MPLLILYLSPCSVGSFNHLTLLGPSIHFSTFLLFQNLSLSLSLQWTRFLLTQLNSVVNHTVLLHILLTALPLSCFVILAWQKTITLVISPPILFLTCATEPGGRETYNFTAWFHYRCTSRNGKSRTLILPTIIITGMPSPFILLLSYATILYLSIQTPCLYSQVMALCFFYFYFF